MTNDPADLGYWEDTTFVFHQPFHIVSGSGITTITRIDTAGMVLEDGVTRDDVIHALINPVAITQQCHHRWDYQAPENPDGMRLTEYRCVDCGETNYQ